MPVRTSSQAGPGIPRWGELWEENPEKLGILTIIAIPARSGAADSLQTVVRSGVNRSGGTWGCRTQETFPPGFGPGIGGRPYTVLSRSGQSWKVFYTEVSSQDFQGDVAACRAGETEFGFTKAARSSTSRGLPFADAGGLRRRQGVSPRPPA